MAHRQKPLAVALALNTAGRPRPVFRLTPPGGELYILQVVCKNETRGF
jgi:hypothetical protein